MTFCCTNFINDSSAKERSRKIFTIEQARLLLYLGQVFCAKIRGEHKSRRKINRLKRFVFSLCFLSKSVDKISENIIDDSIMNHSVMQYFLIV